MLSLIGNLLLLTIIICFIIDLSGIVQSIKGLITRKILRFRNVELSIKPFDCSLCMTWWVGLSYILCIGEFGILGVFLVAMFSFMSSNITVLLIAIKDLVGSLINKIIDYAEKI